MSAYLEIMEELADFSELCENLKLNNTPIKITGVSDSVRAHLVFCVCKKLEKGGLVIVHDDETARNIYTDLCFFLGEDNVLKYDVSELMLHDAEARGHDILASRISVLARLLNQKDKPIVVTTVKALLSVTVPKEKWQSLSMTLKLGDDIELEDLTERLARLGYKREDTVEGAGQFSVRGGIVDIFPYNTDNPYRIEFFDTEVDSVRVFDIESQRTVGMAEELYISPASELILDENELSGLIKTLNKIKDSLNPKDEREATLISILSRDTERFSEKIRFPSADKYIPYIYEDKPTLLDYIPDDFAIFINEPSRVSEAERLYSEEFCDTLSSLFKSGLIPDDTGEYYLSYKSAIKRMSKLCFVGMSGLSHTTKDFKYQRQYSLNAKSISGFGGKPEMFSDSLLHYKNELYRVVILAGSIERAKNLSRHLEDDGIKCSYEQSLTQLPKPGHITVCGGSLNKGFEYPLIRTAVIGSRELFGPEKKRKRRTLYKGQKGSKISDFSSLNVNDYVVHLNHGIGQYLGIEQLLVDGVRKDYLKIKYKNSDTLYVPSNQLDMLYRYDKKEGARVRLNSLGGADWERTKERVKKAAADMAKKLIALYAERSALSGIAFSPDTEWQRDFESAFPFEETDDQLRSIAEVKADMERPHPMDRLLCGDVGYGKTEVALRAAFKAVMSGFQVAYLVPTTILASQHFNTFKQRMMQYPIEIEMLSRFRSASAQSKIIQKLKTGEVDIVIGTHKLLGKNIDFKKLGLLIIDEEQRFGVMHKEKIKELKKDVDVLTLSATPIPRTLHMSLSGIRDMSIINQPPGDRYPVETYVMEYDEYTVIDAIKKELNRGGQVYYMFNRVEGIYKTANKIAELLPNARIAVIHGKMRESDIEQVMMDVSDGEVDVLVCTSIIETGLDIPNVNTIIIENADRLGLSQMYQLRGRVGRSNRLAYAYLTFTRNKQLTEEAEKRLLAMKEFTEFGSGFKIAMRDLEIRGTGNLIGAEQHGHMESVGYEMYCRLLEEAVSEQKGIMREKITETRIDLPVSAYIPDSYITNHGERISAYKKIASIDDRDVLYDVYDEIEDRYGTVPQAVANLMETALVGKKAGKIGISEMIGSDNDIVMQFDLENLPDMQSIVDAISAHPKDLYMTNPQNPKLHFKKKRPTPANENGYLSDLEKILDELAGTKKAESE